jgi:hypothetical protein
MVVVKTMMIKNSFILLTSILLISCSSDEPLFSNEGKNLAVTYAAKNINNIHKDECIKSIQENLDKSSLLQKNPVFNINSIATDISWANRGNVTFAVENLVKNSNGELIKNNSYCEFDVYPKLNKMYLRDSYIDSPNNHIISVKKISKNINTKKVNFENEEAKKNRLKSDFLSNAIIVKKLFDSNENYKKLCFSKLYNSLNDPDSLKIVDDFKIVSDAGYSSLFFMTLRETDLEEKYNSFQFAAKIRAKNAYGGVITKVAVCELGLSKDKKTLFYKDMLL